MRKLKLSLDRLTVESFETLSADGTPRGTVKAFSGAMCGPPTDGLSCWGSCASCGATCGTACGTFADTCATCQTHCEQLSCVEHCP